VNLQARGERPKEATFDLTPMIDVLLLLIVFFMMTSQFTRTQLRPVDLPQEAGEKAGKLSPQTVFLDLDQAGQVYATGRPVALNRLAGVIGDVKPSEADIVIRADRRCATAHLNDVAEALAALGIRNWKLATAPQGGGR
jgi:biopolymer transport protein ExbD